MKAYWITLGERIAQVALGFGVDDLDGTVDEESIFHMAGSTIPQALSGGRSRALIRDAGRIPVERDSLYNVLEVRREPLPAAPPPPRRSVVPA